MPCIPAESELRVPEMRTPVALGSRLSVPSVAPDAECSVACPVGTAGLPVCTAGRHADTAPTPTVTANTNPRILTSRLWQLVAPSDRTRVQPESRVRSFGDRTHGRSDVHR